MRRTSTKGCSGVSVFHSRETVQIPDSPPGKAGAGVADLIGNDGVPVEVGNEARGHARMGAELEDGLFLPIGDNVIEAVLVGVRDDKEGMDACHRGCGKVTELVFIQVEEGIRVDQIFAVTPVVELDEDGDRPFIGPHLEEDFEEVFLVLVGGVLHVFDGATVDDFGEGCAQGRGLEFLVRKP